MKLTTEQKLDKILHTLDEELEVSTQLEYLHGEFKQQILSLLEEEKMKSSIKSLKKVERPYMAHWKVELKEGETESYCRGWNAHRNEVTKEIRRLEKLQALKQPSSQLTNGGK